jgi:excisionase family DNA binding protein
MTERTKPSTASGSLPKYFTLNEVAAHLQISVRTIRRQIAAGDLVAHRIGGLLRISPSDLQIYTRTRRDG